MFTAISGAPSFRRRFGFRSWIDYAELLLRHDLLRKQGQFLSRIIPKTIGTNRQHVEKYSHLPLGAPSVTQSGRVTNAAQFMRIWGEIVSGIFLREVRCQLGREIVQPGDRRSETFGRRGGSRAGRMESHWPEWDSVASTEQTVGTRIGAKKGRRTLQLTVTMRILATKDPIRAMMFYEKESGVGVKGTVRVPARGMTGSSVRKKQQPPSLERQELCYADGRLGQRSLDWLREPGCGDREPPDSHSFLQNVHARCGRRKRDILNF